MNSPSDYAVPHTPPLRHPNAPCDRQGRRVEILRNVDGIILFRYPSSDSSVYYIGEFGRAEGVVNDGEQVNKTKADRFLDRMEDEEILDSL